MSKNGVIHSIVPNGNRNIVIRRQASQAITEQFQDRIKGEKMLPEAMTKLLFNQAQNNNTPMEEPLLEWIKAFHNSLFSLIYKRKINRLGRIKHSQKTRIWGWKSYCDPIQLFKYNWSQHLPNWIFAQKQLRGNVVKNMRKEKWNFEQQCTLWGFIPAAATYRSSFPMAMPIPWTPRSPSPRILLPSVTTIMSTWKEYQMTLKQISLYQNIKQRLRS